MSLQDLDSINVNFPLPLPNFSQNKTVSKEKNSWGSFYWNKSMNFDRENKGQKKKTKSLQCNSDGSFPFF